MRASVEVFRSEERYLLVQNGVLEWYRYNDNGSLCDGTDLLGQ